MGIKKTRKKILAFCYGAFCHLTFLVVGLIMFLTIMTGFTYSVGTLSGLAALIANIFLLLQFPIGHSCLLTTRGMELLDRLAPKEYAKTLRTTIYASLASLQLLALFIFWSPSNTVIWKVDYPLNLLMVVFNLLSWALLTISSIQAGYQLQTGSLGWISLYKNEKPRYPGMPKTGLFALIRQPIYFSFCLVLWTSPMMTLDLFVVAVSYSFYCFFGPFLKELRFRRLYGKEFEAYKFRTPYFFPRVGLHYIVNLLSASKH